MAIPALMLQIASFLCKIPLAPLWAALIYPFLPNIGWPILIILFIVLAIVRPKINKKREKDISLGRLYLYTLMAYYVFAFLFTFVMFSSACKIVSYGEGMLDSVMGGAMDMPPGY